MDIDGQVGVGCHHFYLLGVFDYGLLFIALSCFNELFNILSYCFALVRVTNCDTDDGSNCGLDS